MTDEQGHWEPIDVLEGVPVGTRVRATYTVGNSDDHARERWVPNREPGIYVAGSQVFQVAPAGNIYRAAAFDTQETLPANAVLVATLHGERVSQPVSQADMAASQRQDVVDETTRAVLQRMKTEPRGVNAALYGQSFINDVRQAHGLEHI